ncbi:hypothetical protein [Brevundimonas sp.]|nr:hypothetical protein [Brevundimonas sp.]
MTAPVPRHAPKASARPMHPVVAHGLVATVGAMAWAMLLAALI